MPNLLSKIKIFFVGLDYSAKLTGLVLAATVGVLAVACVKDFAVDQTHMFDHRGNDDIGLKTTGLFTAQPPTVFPDPGGADGSMVSQNSIMPTVSEPVKMAVASESAQVKEGDSITIPEIDNQQPIITATTIDTAKLHVLLDSGVVLYPKSARFGQLGQTILLGHSAPVNWPKIKHDTAFSRIDELTAGSSILVNYRGNAYQYTVVMTQIINQGVDLPELPGNGNSLLLVSCWPPGRNLSRIVVEATLNSGP